MSKKSKHDRRPRGGHESRGGREHHPDAPGGGNATPPSTEDGAQPVVPEEASREGPGGGAPAETAREEPGAPGPEKGGAAPDDVSAEGVDDASAEEKDSLPRLTRKEVVDRLFEKNEMIMKLAKEKKDLGAQLADLKDRWLRTAAEFENYRKRMRKEWDLLQQQTKAEVILDVLGAVDDFERAFAAAERADSTDYVEGFRLIYNNLQLLLEKHGVTPIEARHQPFDPTLHMAVGQMESDEVETGTVVEVVLKGYRLGDTVIRPANVIVAK